MFISARDIKSVHNHNAIIEQKFYQQQQEQQQLQRTATKTIYRRASTCDKYDGSQSHEASRDSHILNKKKQFEEDDTTNNNTLSKVHSMRMSKSLDGGESSLSQSASVLSNTLTKSSLRMELCEKSYSHNEALMSRSRQRQFGYSPESAPYSRMSSSSSK